MATKKKAGAGIASAVPPTKDGKSVQPANRSSMLYILYSSSLLSAWGDRMWEFTVPIILTSIFTDSILPASAFSFISLLAVVVFGTAIGKCVDDADRKKIITISLMTQNLSVAGCAVVLYFLLPFAGPTVPFDDSQFLALFGLLNLLGTTAALASTAGAIAVGRDWVVVISGDDKEALSAANAMLTRISLVCKLAAPVAVGLVLYFASMQMSLIAVCLWNVFSFIPELWALFYIYDRMPELRKAIKTDPTAQPPLWESLRAGWRDYVSSRRTFLPSVSYVFLYFTALCPGPLMSAYLLTRGMQELHISAYQAVSSVVGVVATFLAPRLIKMVGMEKAGLYSIWFQQIFLLLSVLSFFFISNNTHNTTFATDPSIWIFLGCLIFSRMGLWTFDLAERQIMQEYVPEAKRGLINGVEFSLTNVFFVASFLMGVIASRPDQFEWLVGLSFGAVTIAALLYSVWIFRGGYADPKSKQKKTN